MIDIIYKTVMPSHLKKLQIILKIKSLMFQVIFIFSDWILIKQSFFLHPFLLLVETDFRKILPGRTSNFLLSRAWWRELGGEFWMGRGMSKNASNHYIFWECERHKSEKIFHTWWNVNVWEKLQQAFWREIKP